MNEPCKRPGCAGTVVDGFCDNCGRAPVGTASAVTPANLTPSSRTGTTGTVGRSGSAVTGTGTTGTRGSGRTGSSGSRRGTRGTTRRSLGAGLINLEPLVAVDPVQCLLADPVVPEGKRYCPHCNAKLNRVKGFCPNCGTEYSFIPTLVAGDIVAGQYEVKGALAFGGLGWIYLGWDTLLARWVVLKGLLNSKDAVGAQAAVAERQFLATVKHANIVGIYNFVSQGSEGFIVMEYVGGKTLKDIRKERGPLPVPEAIAYVHRILLAFAYLESLGLVYCDFKPDNFMVEGDDVKLIDMGGVRRADDLDGDVYGTKGYSAPEAQDDPSFTSDLYTVARTLAVLLIDFPFQSGKYQYDLPTPAEQQVFAGHDALYRLLMKATRRNPDERFRTADEMAAQLLGVLREEVAATGTPRPIESTHFSGDNGGALADPNVRDYRALPTPRPDPLDPAAGAILMAASLTDIDQVADLFSKTTKQFPESIEAPLLLARARIDQGRFDDAEVLLKKVEEADPFDWQVGYLRGLSLLARGDGKRALPDFDKVYGEVPGELAPKLALALAAEMAGDAGKAADGYDRVSRTDPAFTTASFGLARCRETLKDRAGAVEAYRRVPATSRRYSDAQMALTRTFIRPELAPPGATELEEASATLQALAIDDNRLHQISVELLRAAILQVESGTIPGSAREQVLGQPLRSQPLRLAVERELRLCARFAATPREKMALIDAANTERPWTLL